MADALPSPPPSPALRGRGKTEPYLGRGAGGGAMADALPSPQPSPALREREKRQPDVEWWLGYAGIGVAVGFFAGMLGIGGGAIMGPLLGMLFEAEGLPKAHILHLAVGTGMATILFTSVASVRAHAARGVIRWDIARRITPGILLGGLAGSWIASFI